jgi:hypothetical protein
LKLFKKPAHEVPATQSLAGTRTAAHTLSEVIGAAGGLEALAQVDPHLYGKLAARLPQSADELNIPGEISILQSRMLTHLMVSQWDGHGNVLEIGTLFGRSTQAIGLGMAANPRREGRYFAADFFGLYFPAHVIEERLAPLLNHLPVWAELVEAIRKGSFQPAFEALHARGRPYSSFLSVRRCLIPSQPTDSTEEMRALITDVGPIGVLFVDSAKAYFPLRALALETIDNLQAGALVCWQDQRWFNSYGIPFLTERCSEVFTLLAIGGDMHVYRYEGGLTRDELASRMPEKVTDLPASEWRQLFDDLASRAYTTNDAYGVVSATLQLAFALKDIGLLDEAADLYQSVKSIPAFRRHEDLMALSAIELGVSQSPRV